MADLSPTIRQHLALPDGATVVVVGGGPAGAFFAIRILRRARALGKKLDVLILEKKREIHFYQPAFVGASWEGCNYCAGSISPRLADVLRENQLVLPEEIVEGKATVLTVHGDWKSIELPIPEGRDILSVFRGSRPMQRAGRHANFDSYLLNRATEEGAKVRMAKVHDVLYSSRNKPRVSYQIATAAGSRDETVEADFAVLAGGVNQSPGMDVESDRLFQSLREAIPGFHPPKVRKALICEMQAEEDLLRYMKGEVHFAQYGSKDLQIEMSSLIPKGRLITVVLLGKSVDQADPSEYQQVVECFLELPHVRRLLPRKAKLTPACLCRPNVTVGVARNAFGHRIALVGDMVVSRLYKDGIFSAYVTAAALADCMLETGIDRASLKRRYWPVVKTIHRDNQVGGVVFLLNRLIFSHPVLSRIVYQALLTERKTKPQHERRLANVLWRIASGDDTYRHILASMFHPATVWLILAGGMLVTIRNYVTERLFGLNWAGFGRYSTGVPIEDVAKKRHEIVEVLGIQPVKRSPEFERMYSIRIKGDEARVLHQLGKFGDGDREYFTPRLINVHRTAGNANEVGSTIRYDAILRWLSSSVVLEKVVASRYLLYRVQDGFARDGVLAFDIDQKAEDGGFLTIYVAFNFPRSKNPLKRLAWYLFRRTFPAFIHDVLWNHALCKIKHLVELADNQ
ncbi:MAG: NAD(P)/FAD-dependent oxidoreductase [Thermoguttaceae bacterium]